MIIHTIHATDPEHLAAVKAAMKTLGSPTIRVVDCGDYAIALEGCHRIQAALELGVTITLDILDQDDEIEETWMVANFPETIFRAGETYLAGEVAGELTNIDAGIYEIDADGRVMLVSAAVDRSRRAR